MLIQQGMQQQQVPAIVHSDKASLEPLKGEVFLVRLKLESAVCAECMGRVEDRLNQYYCEGLTILASGHFMPVRPFIVSRYGDEKFRDDVMVVIHPGGDESVDCVEHVRRASWMDQSITSKSASTEPKSGEERAAESS
jgi:hypothetical protein